MFHGFPGLQWKAVGGVSHGWVQGFVPLVLIKFAVKYLRVAQKPDKEDNQHFG